VLRINGTVSDAHPECGNGITWALELRRGHTRQQLANGLSKGAESINVGHFENIRVLPGDVIAMVIGPRGGEHTCDLTAVDLTLHDGTTEWSLAQDVAPDILAGNPHADRHGHTDVWYFFSEPEAVDRGPTIPDGSLLSMWRKASTESEKQTLAEQVQHLMQHGLATVTAESPDRALYQQLLAFNGPLLSAALRSVKAQGDDGSPSHMGWIPRCLADIRTEPRSTRKIFV
jgi:hypothetical protein